MTQSFSVQDSGRALRGGPLSAAATSLLVLTVSWLLLGPGMGWFEVDSILQSANDRTMQALAPRVALSSLLAAALAAWVGAGPDDRAAGRISARTGVSSAIGAGLPVVLVPAALIAVFAGADHTFSLGRILAVVELAIVAGAVLGVASVRWPTVAGMVVAALIAFWLYLTAWYAFYRLFYPDTFYGPDGEYSQEMLRATHLLKVTRTIAHGVVCVLGAAGARLVVPNVQGRWRLAAISASPLLAWAIGTVLAVLAAGSDAAWMYWQAWLALALGCLAAFALTTLMPSRRPTASHYY